MVFFFVSVYISVFKKRLCNVFSSSLGQKGSYSLSPIIFFPG